VKLDSFLLLLSKTGYNSIFIGHRRNNNDNFLNSTKTIWWIWEWYL